jgi:hypothetical protein
MKTVGKYFMAFPLAPRGDGSGEGSLLADHPLVNGFRTWSWLGR